jgi:hypothetical protein
MRNLHEERQGLAKHVFHGRKGKLRPHGPNNPGTRSPEATLGPSSCPKPRKHSPEDQQQSRWSTHPATRGLGQTGAGPVHRPLTPRSVRSSARPPPGRSRLRALLGRELVVSRMFHSGQRMMIFIRESIHELLHTHHRKRPFW